MTTQVSNNTVVVDGATTQNGALTSATSLNANVDLFFAIGSSRGKDISPLFNAAYEESPVAATRILLWARDARGGAGERSTFRNTFKQLITLNENLARLVLARIPELGRWDDVLAAFDTPLERDALRMIGKALRAKNALCAKWMPRKGTSATKIRSYMRVTPKNYRKTLVSLTDVVEQQMCAREWNKIKFDEVPSVASARYQSTFRKHQGPRYAAYLDKVQRGVDKINANALFPYDVVRAAKYGDRNAANEQWKALPDFLNGSDDNILPVVDVSGSMGCPASGSVSCMDVAVSLGMYIAERNTSLYKNIFVTFSNNPQVVALTGDTLFDRINNMQRADWGMNTNLTAVFETVLRQATGYELPESEMPTTILILSDMEFDRCVVDGADVSAMNAIESKYREAGYRLPRVVFWNLNARMGNVPVKCNENGVALVSGFSPAIMKTIVANLTDSAKFTPLGIMMDVLLDERYNY
jgi:hypothetical protein